MHWGDDRIGSIAHATHCARESGLDAIPDDSHEKAHAEQLIAVRVAAARPCRLDVGRRRRSQRLELTSRALIERKTLRALQRSDRRAKPPRPALERGDLSQRFGVGGVTIDPPVVRRDRIVGSAGAPQHARATEGDVPLAGGDQFGGIERPHRRLETVSPAERVAEGDVSPGIPAARARCTVRATRPPPPDVRDGARRVDTAPASRLDSRRGSRDTLARSHWVAPRPEWTFQRRRGRRRRTTPPLGGRDRSPHLRRPARALPSQRARIASTGVAPRRGEIVVGTGISRRAHAGTDSHRDQPPGRSTATHAKHEADHLHPDEDDAQRPDGERQRADPDDVSTHTRCHARRRDRGFGEGGDRESTRCPTARR